MSIQSSSEFAAERVSTEVGGDLVEFTWSDVDYRHAAARIAAKRLQGLPQPHGDFSAQLLVMAKRIETYLRGDL